MKRLRAKSGFSLVELLLVVAVVGLLLSLLAPALQNARLYARKSTCLANLHGLGLAMATYHSENGDYFWPYSRDGAYYWGSGERWIDGTTSPLLAYCGDNAELLQCPAMEWGSYVPHGGAQEPTSTYGYNAWCFDPAAWGRLNDQGGALPRKRGNELKKPAELFVFSDSAVFRSPGGVPILQNSPSLEPVMLGAHVPNYRPTTHFRHLGLTDALCADGHADFFDTEGGKIRVAPYQLGFVGNSNAPHYDEQ